MWRLFLEAYGKLLHFELYVARSDFATLYARVREYPIRARRPASSEAIENICRAVDLACICYWKQVLCLQRSAATTCLLRARGVPALMVIGAQQMPFRAHAWVEVDGCVVNDKPDASAIYSILDRC